QPFEQVLHLGQREITLGAYEVIGPGAGHHLFARAHEASGGEVPRDQCPAGERQTLTLLGCGKYGQGVVERRAAFAPVHRGSGAQPEIPGFIRRAQQRVALQTGRNHSSSSFSLYTPGVGAVLMRTAAWKLPCEKSTAAREV